MVLLGKKGQKWENCFSQKKLNIGVTFGYGFSD